MTSLGYTDEYYGDSTQLTYLRARHYAPGTGRFLTRDTWMGGYNQPLTLNRWNYTEANPINWIDPTGHITEKDNIDALIITEALRIDYNVNIVMDWGYMNLIPYQIYGYPILISNCEWHYGGWRNLHELELVRDGVHRLATKMGGPERFKAAMKYRPVEITRRQTLPYGFTDHTGLALPLIPLYFMTDGLMLPDSPFDIGDLRATYTVIHELGHVWDIRSDLSLSIHMAAHLGNVTKGNENNFFNCLYTLPDPIPRFFCAMDYWKYDGINNEPAPGDTKPYARFSLTEDWAEAVAYTTYPEYGQSMNYREVGPIRKIYVEMMMRDIH